MNIGRISNIVEEIFKLFLQFKILEENFNVLLIIYCLNS